MNKNTKNTKLALVKPSFNLEKLKKRAIVLNEVSEKVSELGDISDLIYDPSVVLQFCNLLENVSSISLKGEEKQDIVISLMVKSFPLLNNDNDIKRIKLLIDFICQSNLVLKVPKIVEVKKNIKTVCEFFLKN